MQFLYHILFSKIVEILLRTIGSSSTTNILGHVIPFCTFLLYFPLCFSIILFRDLLLPFLHTTRYLVSRKYTCVSFYQYILTKIRQKKYTLIIFLKSYILGCTPSFHVLDVFDMKILNSRCSRSFPRNKTSLYWMQCL